MGITSKMRKFISIILLIKLNVTVVRGLLNVKPPKILHEKEILGDFEATLTCQGNEPLFWSYKYQELQYTLEDNIDNSASNGTFVSTLQLDGMYEQGHYYCHYENFRLTDPRTFVETYVYLYSNEEDFAVIPAIDEVVKITRKIGETVVLDCRPTHPNVSVVIKHKEEEKHNGALEDPKMGYVLVNLKAEDGGEYGCSINGGTEKIFSLTVLELERPSISTSKNTYPVTGYDFELYCRILDQYDETPTFKWLHPSEDTRTNTRTEHHLLRGRMFYTSYLRMENVTLKDSGTYNCSVNIGSMVESISKDVIIKETMKPFLNLTNGTQTRYCTKGNNMTWEFQVESFPPRPRVTFNSNQPTHKRFTLSQQKENGAIILTMANVMPSAFGNHSVSITTDNDSSEASLYLIVESEPELTIKGIGDTTAENATINAICNVIGYPRKNVTWFYQSCPSGECREDIREIEDDQITYIEHKLNNYSSEYSFVASEQAKINCQAGEKYKAPIRPIVISAFAKPYYFNHSISGSDKMKDLTKNDTCETIQTDSFNLTCAASKFYYRDLKLKLPSEFNDVSSEDKSTELDWIKIFSVANVSHREAGIYTCHAMARKGYNSKIFTLTHTVKDLENVNLTGFGNMKPEDYEKTQMIREAFSFECSVSGTPRIDITWKKDGEILTDDFGEFKDGNQVITISDLNPSHSGHYECEATNRGGSVKGFLTLKVATDAAKKKFKILRDQFRLEIKKVPFGKSGDPGLPIEEYLSTWSYFKLMFFLRDEIQGRKTVGNLSQAAANIKSNVLRPANQPAVSQELSSDIWSIINEENIEMFATSPQPTTEEPADITQKEQPSCSSNTGSIQSCSRSPSRSRSETPTGPCNKRPKTISVQEQLVNIEREKMEWFKNCTQEDDDADKKFLLSLLPQMKTLPPKKLSDLKIKYMTLLHEASFGDTE